MDNNFETFILFYTAFHEGEMTIPQMRAGIIEEIGEDGLKLALVTFREERLKREAAGDKRTYYDAHKSVAG